jgi:hypothetical protein
MKLASFIKSIVVTFLILLVLTVASLFAGVHIKILYILFGLDLLWIIFFMLRRSFMTANFMDLALTSLLIFVFVFSLVYYNGYIEESVTFDKADFETSIMLNYFEQRNASQPMEYIVMNRGSILVLDLSKYSYDPDNDQLAYSAYTGENLKVDVKGTVVKIATKDDFYGLDSIRFVADDGKSKVSTSDIRVIVKKQTVFQEFISENKVWLTIVAVFVFLMGALLSIESYRKAIFLTF